MERIKKFRFGWTSNNKKKIISGQDLKPGKKKVDFQKIKLNLLKL